MPKFSITSSWLYQKVLLGLQFRQPVKEFSMDIHLRSLQMNTVLWGDLVFLETLQTDFKVPENQNKTSSSIY